MKFAGRLPLNTNYARVISKNGMWQTNDNGETLIACGLACSEIFSDQPLAKVLTPSHELEKTTLAALAQGIAAPTMSLHTSAGVNPALQTFMDALQPHLPRTFHTNDSCISLQVTGADAVWAGADLCLQLQKVRGFAQRTKVAVADWSYHGPGTSAFGRAMPLGPGTKTPLQITYPAPSMFYRNSSETEMTDFHERVWLEYEAFLDSPKGQETGVLLIEPQWGSSNVAQPWNRALLQRYVQAAQSRGILVLADEIMCGLGRHGQGTTFCSDAWELDVDAVTFGKSISAGVEPLAGAVLKQGADALGKAGKSVLQGHTYAGASTRALTTGTAVLNELTQGGWIQRVQEVGDRVIQPMFADLSAASGGILGVQGQGFMWGGAFAHQDATERSLAIHLFRKEAAKVNVLPYMVPESGGFMFTPMMNVPEEDIAEAGKRLAIAVEKTSDILKKERHWRVVDANDPFMGSCTASSSSSVSSSTSSKPRYKGPQDNLATMTPQQHEIYNAIAKNRSTGVAGPFGPWLANPSLAQHAQMLGKTCRYDLVSYDLRRSEMVILMTAIHTNAPTEWAIHVHEARKAGLEDIIIDAIEKYGTHIPEDVLNTIFNGNDESSDMDRSIYTFAAELNSKNQVSDATYWKLHEHFGDEGCVELVGLIGYYHLVSFTLNTFEIQP